MIRDKDAHGSACEQFEEKLVLYYFGDCPPAEQERVEAHLKECVSCGCFLEDIRTMLPKTADSTSMPDAFWHDYYAEVMTKVAAVEPRAYWWKEWVSFLGSWPVPAFGTAVVIILALTLAFTKGMWRADDRAAKEIIPREIVADPGKLDFFKTMDVLESLEFLEAVEGTTSTRGRIHRL